MTPKQLAGALITEAVVFVLLGVVFWRVGWKRMRDQLERIAGTQAAQVDRVQQAVDVIAVEVERISENQRFVSKVLSERSLGAGPAEPVGRNENADSPVRLREQR